MVIQRLQEGLCVMWKSVCIAAVLVFSVSFVAASEDPHCGTFDVRLANGDMHLVDSQNDGPSVGDHRLGTYDLVNAGGNVVGSQVVDLTIVEMNEDGFYLSGFISGVYEKGTIHYKVLFYIGDPALQSLSAGHILSNEYAVVGGTGIFSDASGTVTALDGDDGSRVHRFDLKCPS